MNSAMLTPYRARPAYSWTSRRGTASSSHDVRQSSHTGLDFHSQSRRQWPCEPPAAADRRPRTRPLVAGWNARPAPPGTPRSPTGCACSCSTGGYPCTSSCRPSASSPPRWARAGRRPRRRTGSCARAASRRRRPGRGHVDRAARRSRDRRAAAGGDPARSPASPARRRAGRPGQRRPRARRRRCTPAYAAALAELPRYLPGHGYDTRRAAGAARTGRRRGSRPAALPRRPRTRCWSPAARCTGCGWSSRRCCRPGDRVLVESPAYPLALDAVAGPGGRPVPVPVEDGGLGPPGRRRRRPATPAPAAAYLMPDFQNPTGQLMDAADPAGRRRRRSPGRAARSIVDETTRRARPARGRRAAAARSPRSAPAPPWSRSGRRARPSGAACGWAGFAGTPPWSAG